jgi:hypothetical protein
MEPPTQAVTLGVRCEAPYATMPPAATAPVIDWRLCGEKNGVGLDITGALKAATVGAWSSITVPLRCMSAAADLKHVNAPFAVATTGRLTLELRDVHLARSTTACPAGGQGMINLVHAPQ